MAVMAEVAVLEEEEEEERKEDRALLSKIAATNSWGRLKCSLSK